MRAAKVHISSELLLKVLGFPSGTMLLGTSCLKGAFGIEIVVKDDALDNILKDDPLPVVKPKFMQWPDGKIEMVSWGEPESSPT